MCPLRLIPRIFLFDEEEIAPEARAQRTINRTRIPEIARYLVDNPDSYVFSSLTASIDGEVRFEPLDGDAESARDTVGRLVIPMTAKFVINDGQHRRAAIEEALRERPELGDETISVVFFIDQSLQRAQQMFADLNRHAIRPTKSIGILYDHRDQLSQLARQMTSDVETFQGLVELEKTSISNRSRKLFTLSAIHSATRRLLRKKKAQPVSEAEAELAREFWTEVGKNMPDWQAASRREVAPSELRKDCVHAHGVALQALAIAGSDLIAQQPKRWKSKLRVLKKVNWNRQNVELWEGRAMVAGRISKAQLNVRLTANILKQELGLPLSSEDKRAEERHARSKKPTRRTRRKPT